MTTPATHTTDVIIIGAGPVGLFAIFECGMLKMKCHVIDALPDIGGQCVALYPEKPIYDIPGHPHILAGNLIENLKTQAAPFAPVYHLNQQATGFEKNADGSFTITTSTGTRIQSRAVVIAAGAGAFGPNRPPIENIADFEGRSVFYMVTRKDDFRGKRIAIAGGGDSAVDWAISLADIADKIYFIHRRPKFRAAPDSVAKLEKLAADNKIDMVIPYQLAGLSGTNGMIKTITLENADDGTTKTIDADVLLPFFGLAASLGPLADWGLGIERHHIAVNPATCMTNISGIFAVGDIATYENKLKLILNGFAEAAMAAHAAYPLVFSGAVPHFEYSTSKGLPTK